MVTEIAGLILLKDPTAPTLHVRLKKRINTKVRQIDN